MSYLIQDNRIFFQHVSTTVYYFILSQKTKISYIIKLLIMLLCSMLMCSEKSDCMVEYLYFSFNKPESHSTIMAQYSLQYMPGHSHINVMLKYSNAKFEFALNKFFTFTLRIWQLLVVTVLVTVVVTVVVTVCQQ